jgi:AraC family transcriptional regulator
MYPIRPPGYSKSSSRAPVLVIPSKRALNEVFKEMLRADEMRVLDVAVACGFRTQQHFARVFRRICGASPTEYRYLVLR